EADDDAHRPVRIIALGVRGADQRRDRRCGQACQSHQSDHGSFLVFRCYFFSLAACTATVHFSISRSMRRAKSSGGPPIASKPCDLKFACTSSDRIASLPARDSLSTTSRGVPAGTHIANQIDESKSGMPASAMVGRLGAALGRLADADAIAVSLP